MCSGGRKIWRFPSKWPQRKPNSMKPVTAMMAFLPTVVCQNRKLPAGRFTAVALMECMGPCDFREKCRIKFEAYRADDLNPNGWPWKTCPLRRQDSGRLKEARDAGAKEPRHNQYKELGKVMQARVSVCRAQMKGNFLAGRGRNGEHGDRIDGNSPERGPASPL